MNFYIAHILSSNLDLIHLYNASSKSESKKTLNSLRQLDDIDDAELLLVLIPSSEVTSYEFIQNTSLSEQINIANFISDIDSNFIDRATDGASIASTLTEINKDELVNEVKESIKDGLSIEKDIDAITKKRDKINEKLKGSLPSDKEALYRRWERIRDDVIERENEIIFLKGKIEKATKDYAVNNRNISNMETYAKVGVANEKRIDFITKAIEALETSIGILTVQSINNINGTFNDILKKTDLKNDFKKAIIHQDFSMEVINTANTNLLDPAPDLLVMASFLPAMPALACLFFLILADFCGSVFWKQVLGLATIRPFLGPDEHLKPCLGALPLVRLRIWLTPSAMAEWSSCSSRLSTSSAKLFSDTISCGTTSCVWSPWMALDIVSLDIVSFDSFDAMMTSVIFIAVFIDLTPN